MRILHEATEGNGEMNCKRPVFLHEGQEGETNAVKCATGRMRILHEETEGSELLILRWHDAQSRCLEFPVLFGNVAPWTFRSKWMI